jgi:hypothetical protein
MNLSDYIASIGTRKFAESFNVPIRTAEAWRSGRRTPNRHKAMQIVDRSPVTWEGIYRPGGERTAARGMRPTLKTRAGRRLRL